MEKMQAHAYTTSLVPSFHSPAFLMRVKKSWAGNEAISTYHPFSIFLYLSTVYFITPRRVGGGGVKQLVLSVRPSVCQVSVHSKIGLSRDLLASFPGLRTAFVACSTKSVEGLEYFIT